MTFLAIDAQRSLFILQKSQLQFEQTLVMSRAQFVTKQMGQIEEMYDDADTDEDVDDDPQYKLLQREEAYLETRQDNLDSQITLLENSISGIKNLVNNNIKSSCQLNLLGG